MVERQNDQVLALWTKQLGWLCVCKHALRCIYFLDLKTGGQIKKVKLLWPNERSEAGKCMALEMVLQLL